MVFAPALPARRARKALASSDAACAVNRPHIGGRSRGKLGARDPPRTIPSSSTGGSSAMNDRATMHVGPLGSVIHVLRADPQTVEQLAAIDWSRRFRRVCLDPVRGLITLMSPSWLHEDLTGIFDEIVDVAADRLGRVSKGLRSTRLRGRGEPPGTGMEPDCTFYIGERADGFLTALAEGESTADDYLERNAPDLVVEVELTNADTGKGRALRTNRRSGAVAPARPQGVEGHHGRLPRAAARGRSATARRVASARRAHAGRRVRSGGRGQVRPHPGRAHGGGRTHRPPTGRGARQRGRGALLRRHGNAVGNDHRGITEPERRDGRRFLLRTAVRTKVRSATQPSPVPRKPTG